MRNSMTNALAISLAVGTLFLAAPAAADDLTLLSSSSVPPNVLIGFDTSDA